MPDGVSLCRLWNEAGAVSGSGHSACIKGVDRLTPLVRYQAVILV